MNSGSFDGNGILNYFDITLPLTVRSVLPGAVSLSAYMSMDTPIKYQIVQLYSDSNSLKLLRHRDTLYVNDTTVMETWNLVIITYNP